MTSVSRALSLLALLAILILVFARPTVAQDNLSVLANTSSEWQSRWQTILNSAIDATHHRQEACPGCGNYNPSRPENACHQKYLDTYKHNPVEMTMALGYNDDEDGRTDDLTQLAVITTALTRTVCGIRDGACGFTATDDDGNFEKTMTGPDGTTRTIHLHIVASSLTASDKENRGVYLNEQKDQSAKAKQAYLKCESEGDVCAYEGHGRDGDGQSFDPPKRVVDRNGHVTELDNLHYYKTHPKKDLQDFLDALTNQRQYPGERPSAPPALNGVFSCNGEGAYHFADPILKASPGSGLVLTDGKVDPEVAMTQVFEYFDSVLAMRCQTDFLADVGIAQTFPDLVIKDGTNPVAMHNYLPPDPPPVASSDSGVSAPNSVDDPNLAQKPASGPQPLTDVPIDGDDAPSSGSPPAPAPAAN